MPSDSTARPVRGRATGPRPAHRPGGSAAHVVVLGGGYAGLTAALGLAPHHRVTLVDPADGFTERIRLHQRAATGVEVTRPFSRLLGRSGVAHLPSRATDVDPVGRLVHTDDGRVLRYDRLVYALGSRTATGGGVLGTGDRAYTTETAAELHKHLLDDPGAAVTVVGGGFTGIETVTELAEAHPGREVRLVTSGELGPGLSHKGRDHVRRVLRGLGVAVTEGRRVGTADELDTEMVVWTAALTARAELARRAGIEVDPTGRIPVEPTLRSRSHPEIYAIGDAAALTTAEAGPLRMACATATPMGAQAARAVTADLRGREPRPLRFSYFGACVSLGRRDGLVQFLHPDDRPRERVITGRGAARFKEEVVRTTVRTLRLASRHPGVLRVLPGVG
ncbi:NAD(P)/FAD-dependent oxidoreductase [Streptomyces zingiberis]|uniref:FAD-dependent oxidoreductase n=1 Tax=Streptomyces zingiberis TaxID=2053010 RepID=A0ABX1C4B2_9ACTN|nr:FAD-dependent oxidoreductase [Streptomyces zingiberis]NJQ03641.1 FAD-dependent oxidoreductase [Streptomyces zingiberis]